MTKRFREEVDVANLKVASDQTELQICGVVGEISPMKKGRSASYFDGKMSDGKAKVRLFGFDDSIRKRLSDVSGSAVVLSNCQVKKARYSDDFEVCS